MGADPLFQPATGIGNYTRNLASNLLALKLVDEFTLYANGALIPGERLASLIDSSDEPTPRQRSHPTSASPGGLLPILRGFLASQQWTLRAYQSLMPLVDRARLHPHRDAVFHSPNYLLPAFAGPTVVTIHDLSIQRYPQYHPAERVRFLDARINDAAAGATHVITDSTRVRTEILEYFAIGHDRVTAIPLAAGEEFRPRTEEGCRAVLQALKVRYKKFSFLPAPLSPVKICCGSAQPIER